MKDKNMQGKRRKIRRQRILLGLPPVQTSLDHHPSLSPSSGQFSENLVKGTKELIRKWLIRLLFLGLDWIRAILTPTTCLVHKELIAKVEQHQIMAYMKQLPE